MDTGRFKPLALVKAMSVYALPTRVHAKLSDALGPPILSKPREKGGSVPAGTNLGKRDEVINVEVATPGEAFAKAKTGYRYRIASITQRR